jgi:hypothetical protein
MKRIFIITIFYIIIPLAVSAQSFKISHVKAKHYSYDKFTNDIYYASLYNGDLWVKNLKTSNISPCPFPSIPAFANNSHRCVYFSNDSIIIYNFENGTQYFIDSSGSDDYTFSPNDQYLLFYEHYFSFEDSSIHQMYFSPVYDFDYEWVNENKILISFTPDFLFLYDFITNDYDTIFGGRNYEFSAFAYNKNQELLYYSPDDDTYPQIHTLEISSHSDSLIFDSMNDTDNVCWSLPNYLKAMEWSHDYKRMAFFSYILESGGGIYLYDSDSGKVYLYTDCGGEGGEEYLVKWLNKDTIVYVDSRDEYIYGFNFNKPLAIIEDQNRNYSTGFRLSTYPNPFNGSVNISLEGKIGRPEIILYNINGEEIKRFDNLSGSGNKYNQIWNGSNESGENVSSGIYFILVRDKLNPIDIKVTSKIIYLK